MFPTSFSDGKSVKNSIKLNKNEEPKSVLNEYNRVATFQCNNGGCVLNAYAPSEGVKFVRLCREEVNIPHYEKKTYLMEKIRAFDIKVKGRDLNLYYIEAWIAGIFPRNDILPVCKCCFARCYDVGTSYLDNIIKSIKSNCSLTGKEVGDAISFQCDKDHVLKVLESINDSQQRQNNPEDITKHISDSAVKGTTQSQKGEGSDALFVDEDRRALVAISSRGKGQVECLVWLKDHFDSVGERTPNKDEIHLDPQDKYDIYKMYVAEHEGEACVVSMQTFLRIWRECFPHVKLRMHKAVCGKCATCVRLSMLRLQVKSRKGKDEVRLLQAYHKMTFMAERRSYAERKALSRLKDDYLSIVLDGMQQNHMILPWYGNGDQAKYELKQKMVGCLSHYNEFVGFRIFNNVRANSNLTIHCLLSMLERELERRQGSKDAATGLPHTIFIQFDGAPDNANRYIVAICELVVACGLCKKIVTSRLMVGHTHCDIDGLFGILWKKLWRQYILTPQQYSTAIKDALKGLPVLTDLVDVFVIPDYMSWIGPYIDSKFGLAFKEAHTQLQFIFESTDDYIQFPNGVKVQYRAYSNDLVYELCENKETMLGVEAIETHIQAFPIEGMYVLTSLPELGNIKPDPFVLNSSAELSDVVGKSTADWEGTFDSVVEQWREHQEKAPRSDDVQEYVKANPQQFHIPLNKYLFKNAGLDLVPVAPIVPGSRKRMTKAMSTPSASWSNRGMQTKFPPPRMFIDPDNGELKSLTLRNASDIQIPVPMMTMRQLKDTCKNLGLPTGGSKKDVLVKRIQDNTIDGVFGLSNDEYLRVSLSSNALAELKGVLEGRCNRDPSAVVNNIKAKIVDKSSRWKLELWVKHSSEFYSAIKPDGTCGFVMDYVMPNIRFHQLINARNSISASRPILNFNDVSTRDLLTSYGLSIKRDFVMNPYANEASEVIDFHRRVDGFLDFLKHYVDERSALCDTSLWLSTRILHIFRTNIEAPYSLFQLHNSEDVYSKLVQDTRFILRTHKFSYEELVQIVNTCNFAVLAEKHYYPYRSYDNLSSSLEQAVDNLIDNLIIFMDSSIPLQSMKRGACKKNGKKAIALDASDDDSISFTSDQDEDEENHSVDHDDIVDNDEVDSVDNIETKATGIQKSYDIAKESKQSSIAAVVDETDLPMRKKRRIIEPTDNELEPLTKVKIHGSKQDYTDNPYSLLRHPVEVLYPDGKWYKGIITQYSRTRRCWQVHFNDSNEYTYLTIAAILKTKLYERPEESKNCVAV